MRYGKLLAYVAGATLLAVPAFAQTTGSSSQATQPPGSTGTPDTGAMNQSPTGESMQQPGSTPNAGNPDTGTGMQQQQPSTGATGTTGQTPGEAAGMQPMETSSGVRLYTSTSTNDAGITMQVISNGPVPDTPANREKFPPLSRAGKATKANGN